MANRSPRDKKNVADVIDQQIGNKKAPKKAATYEPLYKVLGESAIPVAKAEGSVWETRMKSALKIRSNIQDCWQEAIKYYNNDQMSHRISTGGNSSGNRGGRGKLSTEFNETENIVFSNITTLVPVIYSKNPAVTMTSGADEDTPYAKTLEELVNVLATKENTPGVGLKLKAKRCVALAELTNNAWIKTFWTQKEDSSEEAMTQYKDYVDQLANAKDAKTVEEIEQWLVALEEQIEFSVPSGPGIKVCSPFHIIVDATSTEDDQSDANWMIELDYLPTQYINCVYGEEDEDGRVQSIYKPSHTLKLTDASSKDDSLNIVDQFTSMSDAGKIDWRSMGFSSQEAFQRSQYTEVAYVWDKVKRRVLMYATNDWSWPIWVWDDPYKLARFFPYRKLAFYLNPLGGTARGEVTYYLDQQDAINEINDEQKRSRDWVKRNVLFDKNKIKQEDVDAYLKGGADYTARGVNLPEGQKMSDVVYSMPPPSFRYDEMFTRQKQEKYESINRIASTNDVMTGTQFKTNTTNKAIDTYQQASSVRTDDRTDALEDFLGGVFWDLAQLCLMNYSPEDVADILDKDVTTSWRQITDQKELLKWNVRVVGGTTTKPTSDARKNEAMKTAQALGQFANAAPMVVVTMLKVLEKAFDNIDLTDEEWQQIIQSVETQQQNSVGGAPGQQGATPPPTDTGSQPDGNPDASQSPMDGAPPQGGQPPSIDQVKQAVAGAVSKGVPPQVAIKGIVDRIKAGQSNPKK